MTLLEQVLAELDKQPFLMSYDYDLAVAAIKKVLA